MNDIRKILFDVQNSPVKGLYSVCTSNYYVIKSSMLFAKENNIPLLLESTSNQVNQYGGYTNMDPYQFYAYVKEISKEVGFDLENLILGGDHLGPNPFQHEVEHEAMPKASEMIRQYVLAGFEKIHVDCSMKLADDSKDQKLADDIIALRTIELINVAEEAYTERKKKFPDSRHPVYIVGSEVPIPGGAQEEHDVLEVTKVEDFKNTYDALKREFNNTNLQHAFEYVIGVVVQPGVEFSDEKIDEYNRANAKDLTNELKMYKNIVFEGHSTDYQTPDLLKEMVEDGIKILKVGPQLTYALREALFALAFIENEMIHPENRSNFIDVLVEEMKLNPSNYLKHYKGDVDYQIKYSLLDRSRYYLNIDRVDNAINKLIKNLTENPMRDSLVSQFLPKEYRSMRNQEMSKTPLDFIHSKISIVLEDYLYAIK